MVTVALNIYEYPDLLKSVNACKKSYWASTTVPLSKEYKLSKSCRRAELNKVSPIENTYGSPWALTYWVEFCILATSSGAMLLIWNT